MSSAGDCLDDAARVLLQLDRILDTAADASDDDFLHWLAAAGASCAATGTAKVITSGAHDMGNESMARSAVRTVTVGSGDSPYKLWCAADGGGPGFPPLQGTVSLSTRPDDRKARIRIHLKNRGLVR